MILRNIISKPFCFGLFVASLTWAITILLYMNISRRVEDAKNSQEFSKKSNTAELKFFGISTKNPESININNSTSWDEIGMVKSLEDQYTRDIGYKQHAFNVLVSNNIGIYRQIPDTRHKICTTLDYNHQLPKASIIMCFFNEHLMTLLRSVNSVFSRTPSTYLSEIILVDDYSDFEDLKEKLEKKLVKIDLQKKVQIIRNKQREGLIRSRVIGSRAATGEVLVFLDSHIEVNVDWIQPLLSKIKEENFTLAVPVIDIINADTLAYTPSPLVRGGFNWGLHFKWENLPDGTLKNESSFAGPFISPTMAGGLFAINRQYFKYLGEYDMGMDIWGGENLELSFRAWLCGGTVKIMPCSRVGHVFRKRRPYSSPDGLNTMLKNSMRLANVWLDEYKDYFLAHQKVSKNYDYGDITDRLLLKKTLKCKPFSWYIQHIYPEVEIPGKNLGSKSALPFFQPWHSRKRTYIRSFLLRLSNTTLCASVDGPKVKGFWKRGSTLSLRPCLRTKNQLWYETDKSELVLDKLYCLEALHATEYTIPVIGKCHEMLGDQEWRHLKTENSPVYNTATGTCLRSSKASIGSSIILDMCSKKVFNSWDIVEY